jgi:alkaline phosphatase D
VRRRRLLRRLALAFLLCGAAPSGLGPARPVADEREHALLVTVAEVGADRAVLWLRSGSADRLRVGVAPADDAGAGRTFEAQSRSDWDHIVRVPLEGLRPGTRYVYRVESATERVEGGFTSAPAAGVDAPVRFLWSGDLGGGGHCRDVEDGYPIFHAMARRHADFFLFVGDTIYADHVCRAAPRVGGNNFVAVSLDAYRAKYRYNRADPAVQELFRVTPVYATWDDHEVTNNFSGPTEPLMPIGRRAFRDYWAVEGPPEEPDRLYRSARWGRSVEVFILDTRQYRSRNTDVDGPGKTMLGAAQRRWLLDGVSASTATWKVIVSSVPLGIFTGAVSDSWTSANMFGYPRPGAGFAHERDLILGTLRERRIPNVVFLTADVHHAQFLRHDLGGYPVYELIAGPLAARQGFPRFVDRSLNSRSLGSLGLANNFGEILVDGGMLRAWIRDSTGATRVKLKLSAETPSELARGATAPPGRPESWGSGGHVGAPGRKVPI